MPLLKINERFEKSWLKPGTKTYWYDENDKPKVVPSEFFREQHDPEENENKIVLAYVLQFVRPNQNFNSRMYTYNPTNSNNKKQKIQLGTPPKFALMLICADIMSLPNTFAIIFSSTQEYQTSFSFLTNAASVSVGDCLGFVEPKSSTDTMGQHMNIMRKPTVIVNIAPQECFPTNNPTKSTIPDKTVGWCKRGLKIKITELIMEIGNKNIPCTGTACDRQDPTCKGCFGKATSLHPIVLECAVQVKNCDTYDADLTYAVFQQFRSYKFSKLFFENIDAVAKLQPDVYESMYHTIRRSVKKLIELINCNGGWTVIGWHRLGESIEKDTGEVIMSMQTKGHLVRIEPSEPNILDDDKFKKELIETPTTAL